MKIGRIEVEEILRASLAELLSRDALLLENDVSERAITHRISSTPDTGPKRRLRI
jgi:hypothetical protein